ncbi:MULTISPECIES: hydrogen peroxide-inducible genes activator [unclassified Epibacterium]|jgi:LysR family hydrogen peroxide-inducible transcriptional activator|uniref:hydrogen peroxide-inducible genes activator n=1 Tax=unclassified Epibacterium TaxID=2639179 RepID=UPI001EF695A9|nr:MULTISPECIES: hydrogen peroxide-inducible genes activator [unclassified Epibacterium]MCG7625007.1 hydrogen peroxide-inducible genes activator [Epibacterium sp. Ofav1-8]MCG7630486.1 hydrogen peroxide-inducible genes activator [Epibacterium sp. MM17-32]
MRPTLRQMDYIVTVHQLASFSLAADKLNVSQPSLSNQVAAVETDLGVRLFERSRAGVRTTARGLEFVTRARRILSEVETLRGVMLSDLPFGGRLRLGVLPSIGPYLLPQAMKALHEAQPDLRVIVREENTLSLDEGLRNGRFDAIISTPEDHPNTVQHPLFVEPLWAAVAEDHPLSEREGIGAADLGGQRLLTLDTGHRLARIVYGIAGQSGAIVSDDYEGTSLDSILLMAATGAGIGILPDLFARRQGIHRSEVRVLPLQMAEADRTISLLSPIDRSSATTEHLAEILRTAAEAYHLNTLRR